MKLAEDVLLEIMSIVQTGIIEMKDVSEMLRNVDIEVSEDNKLTLTKEYKSKKVN